MPWLAATWIALSRSLSSGAHSRDPLDRNDGAIIARMQRSEIRGRPIRIAIPGLRCAASGLRFLVPGRASLGNLLQDGCRSGRGRFVDSKGEIVPGARWPRLALNKESSDALHVYRQTHRSGRHSNPGNDAGHAQARRPRDQGRPHARQWRADAGPNRRPGAHRGWQAQPDRWPVRGSQGDCRWLRDLRASRQGRSGRHGEGIHAASPRPHAGLGGNVRGARVCRPVWPASGRSGRRP